MEDHLGISSCVKDLSSFCIKSFNYVIKTGLQKACTDIEPVFSDSNIKISISEAVMKSLEYPMDTRKHKRTVYPSEARLHLATYYAELHVQLCFQDGEDVEYCSRIFYVPLMVKSHLCFLNGLKEDNLIKVKEDLNDPGGYFIVKGKERLIRHFVVLKRNYPLALAQSKWKTYRENYTEYGILIRSVKDEHIFSNVSLHYLNDGTFEICLNYNLKSYFISAMLIMKALVDKSDSSLCDEILKYDKDFPILKLKNMLRVLHIQGIHTQADAKMELGRLFYSILHISPEVSYLEAADYLLKKSFFIHLDEFKDKFEFLCLSLCKLHCVIEKKCRLDDMDNPAYQEVLSCAQIYLLVVKAGLTSYLKSVQGILEKNAKCSKLKFLKNNLQRFCNRAISLSQVASTISTGNFSGKLYGLYSETGYTIPLKRTNVFELAAQITAICKFSVPHFAKYGRSFYPESWGFLCPTQTPEGENCGLYNQLASQCKIVELQNKRIRTDFLFKLGVVPYNDPVAYYSHQNFPVIVDGRVNGWIHKALLKKLLITLKELKVLNSPEVPNHSEIIFIQRDQNLFPGVYLISSSCRMIRKCLITQSSKVEYIGIFEQVFLQNMQSVIPGAYDYSEGEGSDFLSLSASMIPYFENNAAVRNIFSSVKVKQAVGVPFFNINGRSDTKTSHLIYSQTPIVSSKIYSESNFDFYPYGTNVIVAVMSYTGFDMEDALVLNKASIERGLMHTMVYKTIYYDLEEIAKECECTLSEFEFKRHEDSFNSDCLDESGFPRVGAKVKCNSPLLSIYDKKSDRWIIKKFSERFDAYISAVRLMGGSSCSTKNIPRISKKISITYCIRKVPEVGDKFNNRHGGKGICSAIMQSEDLPFTGDGLIPDVIINPHGLPSRMSIGLLFEMAAAKVNISKGSKYIVKPFESGKSQKTYKKLGEALTEAGFNYYGTEQFYSGTSGEKLEADVFCGSVYFLRLHHVVQEKYQVRSIGPVDEKTYQPINLGLSGAIRFGEMERDAILSHGAAQLTLDRLLHNSDKCTAYLCTGCHQILHPILPHPETFCQYGNSEKNTFCRLCHQESNYKIRIPYVLIYLITELAVLGIKVKFSDE